MNYWIQQRNESLGPFDEAEIRRRMAEGSLDKTSLVKREGDTDWKVLGALEEFKEDIAGAPVRRNPLAMISLACGLVPLLLILIFVLFLILFHPFSPSQDSVPPLLLLYFGAALGAVITGHMALLNIGRSFRKTGGYNMARIGLALGYLSSGGPLLLAIFMPTYSHVNERGHLTQAISNCRQIIITLRLYSGDHSGLYPDATLPDAQTSNEVFRLCFKDGEADNEMIFGCHESRLGNPDGNIGSAPNYQEVVQPGENHWAMTAGLDEKSNGSLPLVYENTLDATWPPKWNPSLAGTRSPGRTWRDGKIIVGFNDATVSLVPLETRSGKSSGLKVIKGRPVLDEAGVNLKILNAEKREQ